MGDAESNGQTQQKLRRSHGGGWSWTERGSEAFVFAWHNPAGHGSRSKPAFSKETHGLGFEAPGSGSRRGGSRKTGVQARRKRPPPRCDCFTDCQRTKTLWSHPDISGVTRPRGHAQCQWLNGKNLLCDTVRMSVPCLHLGSVTVPSRATSD